MKKTCNFCCKRRVCFVNSSYKRSDGVTVCRYICRRCQAKRGLEYYHKNKAKVMAVRKANPNFAIATRKATKKWYKTPKNRPIVRAWRRKRHNKKYKIDAYYRKSLALRNMARRCIRGELKRSKSWERDVGYPIVELRNHIERQFSNGMSWDNYGQNGWELDHITPRSTFTLKTIKKCWELENLRPLWKEDNIRAWLEYTKKKN